jgi:hypothetical protein
MVSGFWKRSSWQKNSRIPQNAISPINLILLNSFSARINNLPAVIFNSEMNAVARIAEAQYKVADKSFKG